MYGHPAARPHCLPGFNDFSQELGLLQVRSREDWPVQEIRDIEKCHGNDPGSFPGQRGALPTASCHSLRLSLTSMCSKLRLDEQRPAVLKACTQSPHALCSQSGAAFLLTCLAQRAREVEVAVEVQERRQQEVGSSFPQISRKKFREFLEELHEASHLDCILRKSRYGVAKRSRHLMAGVS